MKKFIIIAISALIGFSSVQMAFGAEAAKFRIKINGATADNRYFLCMRNAGCMSILAAQRGKVFPFFRTTNMSALFITDMSKKKLSPQGIPASCRGKTVDLNQTVTITGSIVNSGGEKVKVNGLSCSFT